MMHLAAIVEGDGEVLSLPLLVNRLNTWLPATQFVKAGPPIRVRRDRFLNKEDEFRKYVRLAEAKCGAQGWLLILLDADDDCPAELAASVLARVRSITAHVKVSVVFANREFEAWFIAAAASLSGKRGFAVDEMPADPERPRNAKKWLADRMCGSYGETTDQPAFTALFDLQQAHDRSRSFRKLCSEWTRCCGSGT